MLINKLNDNFVDHLIYADNLSEIPITDLNKGIEDTLISILPPTAQNTWEEEMKKAMPPVVTSQLLSNCKLHSVLQLNWQTFIQKPDGTFSNRRGFPDVLWMLIYKYLKTPLHLTIPSELSQSNDFRPTAISWLQEYNITTKLLARMAAYIYSNDADKLFIHKTEFETFFAVKPQFAIKCAPIVSSSAFGSKISGSLAITLMLPFSSLPFRFQDKIDLNDETTWKFVTMKHLEVWAFDGYVHQSINAPFYPIKDIFISQSIDRYVAVHHLSSHPVIVGSTIFDKSELNDDSLSSKLDYDTNSIHFAPFIDPEGKFLSTGYWYSGLDYNLYEISFLYSNNISVGAAIDQIVPPSNVLNEMEQSGRYMTPFCAECMLPRMCNNTCTGPRIEANVLMGFIVENLQRNYDLFGLELIDEENLKLLESQLYDIRGSYEILANEFILKFYEFFGLEHAIRVKVGENDSSPVTVIFKNLKRNIPNSLKLNKSIGIKRKLINDLLDNDDILHDDDDSDQDEDLVKVDESEPPSKRRMVNRLSV